MDIKWSDNTVFGIKSIASSDYLMILTGGGLNAKGLVSTLSLPSAQISDFNTAALTAVGKANQTVGFTLSGGTTSKTLTLNNDLNAQTVLDFIASKGQPSGLVDYDASKNVTATAFICTNVTLNRKQVLYDVGGNDHQFYGTGVGAATFQFRVPDTASFYKWYGATSSTTSNELMSLKSNGIFVHPAKNAAPADADIVFNSGVSLWLDETNSILKAKGKDSAGSVYTYDLNSPNFNSQLLNMGDTIDTTIRGKFSAIKSAIVHYDLSATSSSRLYSWINSSGIYALQRRADNGNVSASIFSVLPNSSTGNDMNIYIGGRKLFIQNQILLGDGITPTITDTILATSVHQAFNYTTAPSGSQIFDQVLGSDGVWKINRINDAGDTVTDTALSLTSINSSTSRLNISGTVVAGDSFSGTQLYLSNNDFCWIEMNNSNASTDLKGWRSRAVNDGSLLISAISDNSSVATTAMQITRTASGGTPTITGIFKFDNSASWNVTSDIGTKITESIVPVESKRSADIVSKIPVCNFQHTEEFAKRYNWKDNSRICIGATAQDIRKVCPEAITVHTIKNEDGTKRKELSYKLDPLFWHLWNTSQDLLNSQHDLIKRVAALEIAH